MPPLFPVQIRTVCDNVRLRHQHRAKVESILNLKVAGRRLARQGTLRDDTERTQNRGSKLRFPRLAMVRRPGLTTQPIRGRPERNEGLMKNILTA
jgi:hypothetical protein